MKEFLIDNFPSLFAEDVKNKNLQLNQKAWDGVEVDYTEFSVDIVFKNTMHIPYAYWFYDLDCDGIPEVIIDYASVASGSGWRDVYWFDGAAYEKIGSLSGGEYYEHLMVNQFGRFVSIKSWSTGFIEIKDDEIIYTDYIDSNGNNAYGGMPYSETGIYNCDFLTADKTGHLLEVWFGELTAPVQFDCSDVIRQVNSAFNPNTGSSFMYISILLTIPAAIILCLKIRKTPCIR